jgi:formate hydrogenlyase transcriptional activator
VNHGAATAGGDWTDEQARTLLELIAAVSRHRDRQQLFDGLSDALSKVFEFDFLGVMTDGPKPGQMQPFFSRPSMALPVLPRSASALSQVFDHGTPIYVRDRSEVAERWPGSLAMLERLGGHSYMGLPLTSRGKVLAALVIQSNRPRAYDAIDSRFAVEAAGIVGVALDNCMHYEELVAARKRLEAENQFLRDELAGVYSSRRIVAESRAMKEVLRLIDLVAPTDATVLVTGESGTGKELVARAIHEKSARAERPLVKLNCAAIPSGLVESELFGHEEGAFTGATRRRRGRFELANGGTLFLDEIGELPAEAQAKLLRVLQHREVERVGGGEPFLVDVRIIAATNRDLEEQSRTGRFRQDLYYRLNVFPIHLPPLRERREDIVPLARAFAFEAGRRLGRAMPRYDDDALAALTEYDWPGNIRELVNIVEQATILAGGGRVELRELLGGAHDDDDAHDEGTDDQREVERALEACKWVIEGPQGAAARLGIKPSTLRSRMRRYGLERPR